VFSPHITTSRQKEGVLRDHHAGVAAARRDARAAASRGAAGGFAGLRIGEACGLRVKDVDFMRSVLHPKQQWKGAPLKNDASDAPIPIPQDLALLLSASVERYPSDMMITSAGTGRCCPDSLQFAVAAARDNVDGLPERFSFHDLRHYYASMLIASGGDLLKVQARMRHAQASTTLNVYGHLWPDADESTKDAVSQAISARISIITSGICRRTTVSS
jgi:integrase